MRVNGNIDLVEGCAIVNLSLPTGTEFPANPSLGEQFYLTVDISTEQPKGEYWYDGNSWEHKPTLAYVKAQLATGQAPSFKTIARACVAHNITTSGGVNLLTNRGVTKTTTGQGVTIPLPAVWLDRDDFPEGTKLRFRAHLSQNETAASVGFVLSLRKVTRPGAGGGGGAGIVIYATDSTSIASVTFNSSQGARAEKNVVTAEFDVPNITGLYAFYYTQSAPTPSGSVSVITATLQAKY